MDNQIFKEQEGKREREYFCIRDRNENENEDEDENFLSRGREDSKISYLA